MEHLIGKIVQVSLKNDDETLSGLLIHVEEYYVYVQIEGTQDMYVLPKANIKYYVTKNFSSSDIALDSPVVQIKSDDIARPASDVSADNTLTVMVDDIIAAVIPLVPSFKVDRFHDDIVRVALGDPGVQNMLGSRSQTGMEYDVGVLKITTNTAASPITPASNTFSIDGGMSPSGMGSQFLTGEQMVGMLNSTVKNKKEAE